MAGLDVTHSLTYNDCFVELRKRPVRTSIKTKEFINKTIYNLADMDVVDVDTMFATVKDLKTKLRMQLPAPVIIYSVSMQYHLYR